MSSPNKNFYSSVLLYGLWSTELEESCDTELDFDPIAFRCDFDEYDNLEECLNQYDSVNSLEELRDHTTVIEVPNSEAIIIQAF